VTIVEMLDSLIPTEDADAAKELSRAFKKRGITMHLGARATRIEHGDEAVLHFESSDGTAGQVAADLVLVATGRGPNVADIGSSRPASPSTRARASRPTCDAHERDAHLRRRRRGRPLPAGPHVVP
jgi:NADPH-dependent 2,4-dienoyl-CoA reductase/sulfur reductase-like enzyme